ncbi:MAG: hypothetical protein RL111_422 [Pseudomonadota bacterium]
MLFPCSDDEHFKIVQWKLIELVRDTLFELSVGKGNKEPFA